MKKYRIILIVFLVLFLQTNYVTAQLRQYLQPIAGFDDGEVTNSFYTPVVNSFGEPICCENSEAGEFNFELSFGDFSIISQLQS